MYMIEITEDKMDGIIEHIGKGLKCFHKAMECLEELKEESRYGERDDDYEDDEYMSERYGNRGRYMNRYGNRRGGSGRYSRY